MAHVTGKTGADAIGKALKHICRTLISYEVKLRAHIEVLAGDGTISADQHDAAITLLDNATAFCAAFIVIAEHSGF